jgi:hypothetical protein
MKLNHVSTFSGEGQLEIIISRRVIEVHACRWSKQPLMDNPFTSYFPKE